MREVYDVPYTRGRVVAVTQAEMDRWQSMYQGQWAPFPRGDRPFKINGQDCIVIDRPPPPWSTADAPRISNQ